jgi:hypothetical protein
MHFNDYDPDKSSDLGFYDDGHDHTDDLGWKFGPYRPLHPIREGFTLGVAATIVVGVLIWLIYEML